MRDGALSVPALRPAQREEALALAEAYLAPARDHRGGTRGALEAAWSELPVAARARRLAGGLLKLIEDRCTFESPSEPDPIALRRAVFQAAAARRRSGCDADGLDRAAVLTQVAAEHDLSPAELEGGLYTDLKSQQRLVRFDDLSAESLVSAYELAGPQAVLLRALWLRVDLYGASPETYRAIFQRLKFHGLLFTLDRLDPDPDQSGPPGYRLELDGPYSLFSSVTKYGLKLALVLPILRQAPRWELQAKILWGKQQRTLDFNLAGATPEPKTAARRSRRGGSRQKAAELAARPEVEQLRERFAALDSDWSVTPANEILELPGVGLCVPDLCFERGSDGQRVFLEVMGFWSRAAVWRRVELVQAGLDYRVLFAVSKRLRVSEAVLDPDLPGALYVFKGVISPREVLRRLERLCA